MIGAQNMRVLEEKLHGRMRVYAIPDSLIAFFCVNVGLAEVALGAKFDRHG
jgi:hypothetical protein